MFLDGFTPSGAKVVNLTNEEYHALPAIGSSMLKEMARSMRHYWSKYIDPNREPSQGTDAMAFGTLLHCQILEPENMNKTMDYLKKSPSGVKALRRIAEVYDMDTTLEELPTCDLIRSNDGVSEHTIIWDEIHNDTGDFIKCKTRLDRFHLSRDLPDGLIMDIKSTKDASPSEFQRSAWNLGYHIQSAWYKRGVLAMYGLNSPFIFLAGETSPPYPWAQYVASDDWIKAGSESITKSLTSLLECRKLNVWKAYDTSLKTINCPAWARRDK